MFEFAEIDRHPQSAAPGVGGAGGIDSAPGWARGLRQLYDGVAEEPVPAELDDLLARLHGSLRRSR